MSNFLKNLFGAKSAEAAPKPVVKNNFFKWNRNAKYRLVGKINGLAADVRRTRFRLVKRAQADKPTWVLANRKHSVGIDIRHHLLAYAFMRGTSYIQLERKCRKDNKPSAATIWGIVKMHLSYENDWNLTKVEEWLSANGENQ